MTPELARRNIRLLMFFNFFEDFLPYSVFAILIFAEIGGSFTAGAAAFSVTMLTTVIFEVPTGIVSDLVGRKGTMVLGAGFSAAGMMCYVFAQDAAEGGVAPRRPETTEVHAVGMAVLPLRHRGLPAARAGALAEVGQRLLHRRHGRPGGRQQQLVDVVVARVVGQRRREARALLPGPVGLAEQADLLGAGRGQGRSRHRHGAAEVLRLRGLRLDELGGREAEHVGQRLAVAPGSGGLRLEQRLARLRRDLDEGADLVVVPVAKPPLS